MNIKIRIVNALTDVVEVDNTVVVEDRPDATEIAEANWNALMEMFPDSHVNFVLDNGGFFMGMPSNMRKDELLVETGLMEWEDYTRKWYGYGHLN